MRALSDGLAMLIRYPKKIRVKMYYYLCIIMVSLFASIALGISIYFMRFWLQRLRWKKYKGIIVGHKLGGIHCSCSEHSVIEVITERGKKTFDSMIASYPPVEEGTVLTVLNKPDTDEFIEMTWKFVFLSIVIPLLISLILIWLATNTEGEADSVKIVPIKSNK